MVYEEVSPGMWTPEEDGDCIEGVFIRAEKDVGPQKSMLYHLEVEGKPMSFWGCAILDQRMIWVKSGSKIRVTFKGLAEAQPGKNPAKIFKVEIDTD